MKAKIKWMALTLYAIGYLVGKLLLLESPKIPMNSPSVTLDKKQDLW